MTAFAIPARSALARSAAIAAATGLAAVALIVAGPASAGPFTTVLDQSLDVTCGATGQTCSNVPTFDFVTLSPEVNVEFTAGDTCSSIIPHILIDGHLMPAAAPVAPNQSDGGQSFHVGFGKHTIGVKAEGVTGGCNTGHLASYQGHLHVDCADALSGSGPGGPGSGGPGSGGPGSGGSATGGPHNVSLGVTGTGHAYSIVFTPGPSLTPTGPGLNTYPALPQTYTETAPSGQLLEVAWTPRSDAANDDCTITVDGTAVVPQRPTTGLCTYEIP